MLICAVPGYGAMKEDRMQKSQGVIQLPQPDYIGTISVEEAIHNRRSVRKYSPGPLILREVGQLLWAAQGASGDGKRNAPSAGATYPLEVYLVAGAMEDAPAGIYKYDQKHHMLLEIKPGDYRQDLSAACLGQPWVLSAPVSLVITAVPERTTQKYGKRGFNYVYAEVGHASENVYLQAFVLGLGTVVVGAFDDDEVSEVLGLGDNEIPIYVMPAGSLMKPCNCKKDK